MCSHTRMVALRTPEHSYGLSKSTHGTENRFGSQGTRNTATERT